MNNSTQDGNRNLDSPYANKGLSKSLCDPLFKLIVRNHPGFGSTAHTLSNKELWKGGAFIGWSAVSVPPQGR